jgi:hypothetical protein
MLLIAGDTSTAELIDVLVALDAQSVTDFELIIVPPSALPHDRQRLEELLVQFSSGLNARSLVLPTPLQQSSLSSGAAAIDAAIAAARGRYLSILDGRTVVFAHYVEIFERLSTQHRGEVLRVRAVAQSMRKTTWPGGRIGFEPVTGATPASSPHFDLLGHLVESGTPRGSYALPRSYFDDLNTAYQDALPGCEEDEVLLEAALHCGVHQAPDEVTVLVRKFIDDQNEINAKQEDADRQHDGGVESDNAPPEIPGRDQQALLDETTAELERTKIELFETRHLLDNAQHGLAATSAELLGVRTSTSWRVTAPLRRLSAVLRRTSSHNSTPSR